MISGMKPLKLTVNDLLMLLVVTIWALNLSLVKIALREIPPLPYNGIRLLLAAAVLLAWLLVTEKNLRLRRQDLPKIVLLSFSGYALYQYLFIFGIDLTTASNTAVIFGSTPIMISLLSSFFKHEKITPLGWLGIGLGFFGIYLVISGRAGGFRGLAPNLERRPAPFCRRLSLGPLFGVGPAAAEDLFAP